MDTHSPRTVKYKWDQLSWKTRPGRVFDSAGLAGWRRESRCTSSVVDNLAVRLPPPLPPSASPIDNIGPTPFETLKVSKSECGYQYIHNQIATLAAPIERLKAVSSGPPVDTPVATSDVVRTTYRQAELATMKCHIDEVESSNRLLLIKLQIQSQATATARAESERLERELELAQSDISHLEDKYCALMDKTLAAKKEQADMMRDYSDVIARYIASYDALTARCAALASENDLYRTATRNHLHSLVASETQGEDLIRPKASLLSPPLSHSESSPLTPPFNSNRALSLGCVSSGKLDFALLAGDDDPIY
ncbi:hypothetical protein IWQ60_004583 [Tieghemiomyces parasiticus]|uniref:Uncharacterized protein n=1 Tax=Tieghemiomyces parasiticus TaxID=78921 RepID=A0A9W8ADF6_9FUNG|nr:hypothetical protein IWQ60_004583 [Tieghemiomyces parasiticus]